MYVLLFRLVQAALVEGIRRVQGFIPGKYAEADGPAGIGEDSAVTGEEFIPGLGQLVVRQVSQILSRIDPGIGIRQDIAVRIKHLRGLFAFLHAALKESHGFLVGHFTDLFRVDQVFDFLRLGGRIIEQKYFADAVHQLVFLLVEAA